VLRPDVPRLHSDRQAHAFVKVNAKGGESIVVSDASNNVVDIFDAAGEQTAQLTGFSQPQGLGLDKQGNLYVADTSNGRIQVYAPGFTSAPKTIDDPGQSPASVAIDRQGNLAVANILTASGASGSVSFFDNAGSLLTTLSNPSFAKVIFDAFDRNGNLYIDGTNASGGFVAGEIVGGVKGTAITVLTTGNTVGYPGGIAISKSGNIAICDQKNVEIFTYAPPVKGSLGSPTATTTLTGAGDPISIAFTRSNKGIWVADAASSGALQSGPVPNKVLVSSADKYSYTAGGNSKKAIFFSHGSEPNGIVISPATHR
jgi:hypothetical protein